MADSLYNLGRESCIGPDNVSSRPWERQVLSRPLGHAPPFYKTPSFSREDRPCVGVEHSREAKWQTIPMRRQRFNRPTESFLISTPLLRLAWTMILSLLFVLYCVFLPSHHAHLHERESLKDSIQPIVSNEHRDIN